LPFFVLFTDGKVLAAAELESDLKDHKQPIEDKVGVIQLLFCRLLQLFRFILVTAMWRCYQMVDGATENF